MATFKTWTFSCLLGAPIQECPVACPPLSVSSYMGRLAFASCHLGLEPLRPPATFLYGHCCCTVASLCSMPWLNCTAVMLSAIWLQAEARQLPAAETNCRAALKASGGCHSPSWALLALVLSARQHIAAALAVASAALEEAGPPYEGLLLKIKVWLLTVCITQQKVCISLFTCCQGCVTSQYNGLPATQEVSLQVLGSPVYYQASCQVNAERCSLLFVFFPLSSLQETKLFCLFLWSLQLGRSHASAAMALLRQTSWL